MRGRTDGTILIDGFKFTKLHISADVMRLLYQRQKRKVDMFKLMLVTLVVVSSGVFAGEIGSDQLIDGYITYTTKASGAELDQPIEVTDETRKGLLKMMGKEHPVLAPYAFEGETLRRAPLKRAITKMLLKCEKSKIPVNIIASFAAKDEHLKSLSDVELVVAYRVTKELVKMTEQQSEALEFVKECVRQVKRKDPVVFKKITDANVLTDVKAELNKRYGSKIEWDQLFGKLSELSDEQIENLFTTVLTLQRAGGQSPTNLTDKRGSQDKTVQGTYMRFRAQISPEFRGLFKNQNEIGFGVYIIEGKKYWEPFGW
mgnify:CR=1 FL=1